MDAELFVDRLAAMRFSNVFNPYADICPLNDVPDAPKRRRRVLAQILQAAQKVEIEAIWIGRDLGYRGGRRTGLALTDDAHCAAHTARWGLGYDRPTKGVQISERTAAVIWRQLSKIAAPIFLWNVFPLHPHEPDSPFTNRQHNSAERDAGESVLAELISAIRPRVLVALGNEAGKTAKRLAGPEASIQIRHPSYGGLPEFLRQTRCLYGLAEETAQSRLL